MQVFQYIEPLTYTAETNETLIAKKVIRVLDCSNNIDDSACSLWKYTKCDSDQDYCNPYVAGDIIYLQKFLASNPQNLMEIFAEVYDSATDLPLLNNGLTIEKGTDSKGIAYANIIINTETFLTKCFYIKTTLYNCRISKEDRDNYNTCVDELVSGGKTVSEAKQICLTNYCDPIIMYSEPYCLAPCVNTLLLEGFYPAHDCYGYFYGAFSSGSPTNSYKNQIRVFATVQSTNFTIDEVTTNGTKRTSTKLNETYIFRNTFGVPYYVANKIATIFAAKYVYIESIRYENTNNVDKNNDENNMWFIATNMNIVCNDNDFSCNK